MRGERGEKFALIKKILGRGNIVCKRTELGEDLEDPRRGGKIGVLVMQK